MFCFSHIPTIDNYLNHFWYDMLDDDKSSFLFFLKVMFIHIIRGNIWPDDLEEKKIRLDHKICLFNNSAETNDIEELKSLW